MTDRPDAPRPDAPGSVTPRPDAGFTLLELMVVVTILVMLTVAAGSVALNYLGRARGKTAELQIAQVETGLDLYRLDVGRYPTTAEGLDALVTPVPGLDAWSGPYVKDAAVLRDPWGAPFAYALVTDADYALRSFGSDGVEGGDGDATDVGR